MNTYYKLNLNDQETEEKLHDLERNIVYPIHDMLDVRSIYWNVFDKLDNGIFGDIHTCVRMKMQYEL